MPSSWTQNIYHAVFSTKRRVEIITPDIEDRLYPFVGGILKDLRCVPIAINGTADHLHLLTIYPSDLSHADMLRHVKKRSSEWIHDTFAEQRNFAWQEGYGGFTVSKSVMDEVAGYIRDQKEHHKRFDSLSEFKEMLKRHGIQWDPKYLE
jgi:REP element-mobilizing transposase RayT